MNSQRRTSCDLSKLADERFARFKANLTSGLTDKPKSPTYENCAQFGTLPLVFRPRLGAHMAAMEKTVTRQNTDWWAVSFAEIF
jgi:hypothetical protein